MKLPVKRMITVCLITVILLITRGTASAYPTGDDITADAALVTITNEAGNLSEYSGAITDNGDLSVTTSAALAGSRYGLQVVLDDTTNIYAYKALPAANTTGVLNARIYVDPNSLSMAYMDELSFAYFVAADGVTTVGSIQFFYQNGYRIRGAMLDDGGTHLHTQPFAISDGPHRIDIRFTRATSSSAKNGSYEIWIDGVAKPALTGVDNYDRYSSFKTVALGANSSVNKIRGTYFLDELTVGDAGAPPPGPTPPGPTPPNPTPVVNVCSSVGCKAFLPFLRH